MDDCDDDTLSPILKQNDHHFYGNDRGDAATAITNPNHYDQTTWLKQLLAHYGNTLGLIDATYKTSQ